MRIALVSTLATRVRPSGSGSIESLVWLLGRELSALGHAVTTFALEGSVVSGELVSPLAGTYGAEGSPDDWQLCEWINLCAAVTQSDRFDLVHAHAYLWSLPLEPLSRAPIVHTSHVLPWDNAAALWSRHPGSWVTAISAYQWSAYPRLRPAAVIPHGIDASAFTFRAEPEDYVCFLGRFIPGKGPLEAIAAARAAGLRILLAGPANEYFNAHVAPLVDGRGVEYLGPIGGAERDRLLGGARALLYPNREPEPFGLVMAEAMMCGTPVVASAIGAVPEIVEEGVTGYLVAPAQSLAAALDRARALDRGLIYATARERFSSSRMAERYLEVYRSAVASYPASQIGPAAKGKAKAKAGGQP